MLGTAYVVPGWMRRCQRPPGLHTRCRVPVPGSATTAGTGHPRGSLSDYRTSPRTPGLAGRRRPTSNHTSLRSPQGRGYTCLWCCRSGSCSSRRDGCTLPPAAVLPVGSSSSFDLASVGQSTSERSCTIRTNSRSCPRLRSCTIRTGHGCCHNASAGPQGPPAGPETSVQRQQWTKNKTSVLKQAFCFVSLVA